MYDINKLTLGEVAKVEELSGHSIREFQSDQTPAGKMMAALAFVVKRRTGSPEFKWSEALELTMGQANEILGIGDETPEDAEATAAGPTS